MDQGLITNKNKKTKVYLTPIISFLSQSRNVTRLTSPFFGDLNVDLTNDHQINANNVKEQLTEVVARLIQDGHNLDVITTVNPEKLQLLATNSEDEESEITMIKLEIESEGSFFENFFQWYGIFIFCISEIMSEIIFLLAAQTIPALQDNIAVSILGSSCTLIIKAFVYYYSKALDTYASIGRGANHLLCEKETRDQSENFENTDPTDDLYQKYISNNKVTNIQLVASLILLVPALGMTGAQALTGYQSTIALGEEARDNGSEVFSKDFVFYFAIISTFTGICTTGMQNVSFALQASPAFSRFLDTKLSQSPASFLFRSSDNETKAYNLPPQAHSS